MNIWHLFLLSIYCSLGILNYLLIRLANKQDTTINYPLIVLETELVKLVITTLVFFQIKKKFLISSLTKIEHLKYGWHYIIPAFIYCIYNLLTLYNLHYLDPSTYQVIMQSRIIFTTILFQILLQQRITFRQWIAIGLLTTALTIKHLNKTGVYPIFFVGTTLFQALLTSIASTYNEKLLKENRDFIIQNGFMYSFGTLFNLIIFTIKFQLDNNTSVKSDFSLHQDTVQLFIVLTGAVIGLTTSLILKYINSIAKIFASAIDISFAAPIYALFLKETTNKYDYLSCLLVSLAILLYYYKPTLNEEPEPDEQLAQEV